MYTKIYDIAYEINGDEINLEQESGCGETSMLTLHRWQLAPIAELMGIVKAAPDGESQKTIATLTRRLNLLRDRIDFLADWLANNSDHEHADLDYETTYARATSDIAEEFCADLMDTVTPGNAACNVTPNSDAAKPGVPA